MGKQMTTINGERTVSRVDDVRPEMTQYTADTLPSGLPTLRTGTANDGRMLIRVGPSGSQQESALRDIEQRLPRGWTVGIYEPSGVDAVITHTGEE